jgi:hypothetical protein
MARWAIETKLFSAAEALVSGLGAMATLTALLLLLQRWAARIPRQSPDVPQSTNVHRL